MKDDKHDHQHWGIWIFIVSVTILMLAHDMCIPHAAKQPANHTPIELAKEIATHAANH